MCEALKERKSQVWLCALMHRYSSEGERCFIPLWFLLCAQAAAFWCFTGYFQNVDMHPLKTILRLCINKFLHGHEFLVKIKEIVGEEKLFSHLSSWLPHCPVQRGFHNSYWHNMSRELLWRDFSTDSAVSSEWAALYSLKTSNRIHLGESFNSLLSPSTLPSIHRPFCISATAGSEETG